VSNCSSIPDLDNFCSWKLGSDSDNSAAFFSSESFYLQALFDS